jgi:hypothetical protein
MTFMQMLQIERAAAATGGEQLSALVEFVGQV